MWPSWEPHQLRSQCTCQTTYISSHTIKTKSNQNIPNHCTTWTLGNFSHAWIVYHHSHSLIIHTVKTKEITTVKEVWICDLNYHKNLVKFCFDFLQELLMVWEATSNIPKGVSSNIQTSWSWLKKTWPCLVFSTTSRCLDIGWNTLPHVWYITSNSIWPNWILLYHFSFSWKTTCIL